MIGISKLYCGQVEPSDALRYGRESGKLPSHLLQFSKDKKPVVVWNMMRPDVYELVAYAHGKGLTCAFSGVMRVPLGEKAQGRPLLWA